LKFPQTEKLPTTCSYENPSIISDIDIMMAGRQARESKMKYGRCRQDAIKYAKL
jgi:hypothetical protein